MAEFICRLGTPSGDIITRIVESSGTSEAKGSLKAKVLRFRRFIG